MSRMTVVRRFRSLSQRRISATLGDLIAAAYDALGPDAGVGDVARLLEAPAMVRSMTPRPRIG